MISRKFLSFLIAGTFIIASCGNDQSGQSTPIDSTNEMGKAPVEYREGQPGSPVDTSMPMKDQKMREQKDTTPAGTPPQNSSAEQNDDRHGVQTPASNTSDKKTTSGSVNKSSPAKKK